MSPLSSQITGTHCVSALPTYMPACRRAVLPPHQLDWCRVRCQLLLAEMCLHCVLLASRGHGQMVLMLITCGGLHELCGFSEMFWGLLAVPSSTGEIGHCQQVSQAHKTPQYLTGAFSSGIKQPPHLQLRGNFSLHARLARLRIWEL